MNAVASKKTVAVLHIGSGSVGIACASLSQEGPIFHYSKRRYFDEKERPTLDRYLSRVMWATTSSATEMAMDKTSTSFTEVHCFVPSLLAHREVRKIKYSSTVFTVTEHLISSLIEEEVRGRGEEDMIKKDKILIEKKVLTIQLNGYPIEDPYGKQASEVTITLFLSYAEKTTLTKLKNIIHQIFHVDEVYFHSTPLVVYSTLNMLFPNEENFTILNVSGEMSDIVTSVDNELSQMITLPFGGNTLLRLLGHDMGVGIREAYSILELYKSNGLSEGAKNTAEQSLLMIRQMWKEGLGHSIAKGNLFGALPAQIFIMGDKSVLYFLPGWFEELNKDFFDTGNHERFVIKKLSTDTLINHFKKDTKISPDSLLVLLSVFTNNLK